MKKTLLLFATVALLSSARTVAATTTTIDGGTYTVDTLQHFKVGPGSYYTAIKFEGESLTFRTFYLDIDRTQPSVDLRMELGRDSVIGVENISSHAQRKTADGEIYYAAVNGDFYATSGHIGTPVNGGITEGMLATVATGSPHYFLDSDKLPYASYVTAANTVTIGGTARTLTGVNKEDLGSDELVVFNSANGYYTHTSAGTPEVALELLDGEEWNVNGTVKTRVVGSVSTTGNRQIASGQAVLSGTGSMATVVEQLQEGDEVDIAFSMQLQQYSNSTPDLRQMVGGSSIFLSQGATVAQGDYSRHPRTMLGYNADRTHVIFAVVDGRSAISSGATYVELADIMKWAGAYEAINVDGGGSSSMYFAATGTMNVPSDGKERSVANGIYAVLKAPDDNVITEIRFLDWSMKFPKYGVYTPTFYGYNQYGMLIDTDVQGVTLTCDSNIGEIIDDGATFYGSGDGIGVLRGNYNGLTCDIPVVVEESDDVAFRLESVIVDNYHEYPIEVLATVGEEQMEVSPIALTWASADEAVATVGANDGVLKGVADGETTVTGTIGDFTGTLAVSVENPTARVMPIISELDASGWTFKQTGGTNQSVSALENGFAITYTGNGTSRGAYLEAACAAQVWGLPDKLQIRVNPGDASIDGIKMNVSNALGESIASWVIADGDLPANTESTFEADLTDWCDPDDLGIYPITINTLRFEMGRSASGTEFTISVPGFEAVYSFYDGGSVGKLTADEAVSVYPNPVSAGSSVRVKATGDATVSVYTLGGSLVGTTAISGSGEVSTAGLQRGVYLLKVATASTVKTAKLIIK